MIFGNPQLRIVRHDIDLLGILHLETARMWQPDASGLDPLAILQQRPTAPAFGNTLQIAESTVRKGGAMETHWTHEGYSTDPSQPFKTFGVSNQWGFDPAFEETSLLLHPDWSTFENQYGGQIQADNSIDWPQFISPTSAQGNGFQGLGAASDSSQEIPNPFFGAQTYYSMASASWTYRWADTKLKPDFFANIGKIADVADIPGNPPTPDGRNWLKLPVKFRPRGYVYEFIGTWWLSGLKPWITQVYAPDAGQNPNQIQTGNIDTGFNSPF